MTTTRFAPPRFKGMDSNDLHAWVELEDGKKMDYPPQELKYGMFGSLKTNYVPFDDSVQKPLFDRFTKSLKQKYASLPQLEIPFTKDDLDRHFITTGGCCMYRALILHKRLTDKGIPCKVVFGSLGFIQPDGSIFYEFG